MLNFIPLWYYILSALINFLTAAVIAIVVFLANKESKTNKIFSAFSFSVAYWSLLYFAWLIMKNKEWAEFYLRSCMIGVLFMPSLFFHFVALFLNIKGNKKFIAFNYILSLLFTSTVYTPFYAKDIGRYSVFPYWLHTGPVFHFALIHFGIVVLYSFYLMWKSIKKGMGVFRNQILYVFIGTAVGYISGVVNFFYWYRINIPPFLNIFISVYVIMVAIAIVRYHLLDINLVLTRSGIFVVVYTFVLGLPFVALKWLKPELIPLLGENWWIVILVFGMVLASAGPFIFLFLRRRAEDLLFKEQKAYQQALIDLAKNMTRIRDLDKLYRTIVLTVVERVKVPFAAIYLKDEHYQGYQLKHYFPKREKERFPELIPLGDPLIELLTLKKKPLPSEELGYQDKIKLDSGLAIPCFMADTLLGFLVIGPKPGNRIYAPSDLLIFETLSYATALAIENSQFWREIEDRHRKARLQEMDTFSYSLAHEIDNPMTFVYNLARFLKGHFLKYITEQDERKEVEEACGYIMEGSERVMGMVKAIRQFGQKTTGELETLNLQEVIEGFFKLYAPELKAHFVICAKEMPDDAIYVKGVAAELQQVLMIFSKNSIHAMNYSQEKKLSLKLTKLNHSTARIAVSDTGCGIKKENLHTIFEPFFTTKASTEGRKVLSQISRVMLN